MITTPRTPLSLTSTFDPPPSSRKGTSISHNFSAAWTSSSAERTKTRASAGPPMRAAV